MTIDQLLDRYKHMKKSIRRNNSNKTKAYSKEKEESASNEHD